LDVDWLAMKEPTLPSLKDFLASNETVINPYYMKQLLVYGIKQGQRGEALTDADLEKDAERLVKELKSLEG